MYLILSFSMLDGRVCVNIHDIAQQTEGSGLGRGKRKKNEPTRGEKEKSK